MNNTEKSALNDKSVVRQNEGFRLRRTPCCVNLYDVNNLPVLSLNDTSALIWENCTGAMTVSDLIERFSDAFPNISPEKMKHDVMQTLRHFELEKVIVLT